VAEDATNLSRALIQTLNADEAITVAGRPTTLAEAHERTGTLRKASAELDLRRAQHEAAVAGRPRRSGPRQTPTSR
jgi:hypothetical protein